MAAYYNEWDGETAQWLRNLMRRGLIPDGYVDERSITDVEPDDLKEYTQCHFFAGIGGWPLALRMAGWPDERPVWSGSPPCQPFSNAGKKGGKKDPRHLAPKFAELVRECSPTRLFGEQVAAAVKKDNWVDDLRDTLGKAGYTFGFSVLPACGIGAPHKRERIMFGETDGLVISHGERDRCQEHRRPGETKGSPVSNGANLTGAGESSRTGGDVHRMADDSSVRSHGRRFSEMRTGQNQRCKEAFGSDEINFLEGLCATGDVAYAYYQGLERWVGMPERSDELVAGASGMAGGSADTDYGVWSGADWLGCRDGKFRPVRPGSQPLAHGVPGRVVRLRAYGNAIVPPLAAQFILSFEEALIDLYRSRRPDIDDLI